MIQDLKYAARGLLRARTVSAIAIGTLALGIGATSAMFSVVNGVLLRPMPYRDPGRLVTVWTDVGRGQEVLPAVSGLDLRDLPSYTTLFDGFAAGAGGDWAGAWGILTGTGASSERVTVGAVSANFFDVLGVRPLHGRAFTADETRWVSMAQMVSGPQVAMLSYALWQRRFGGDTTIVGRTIEIDATPHQVVGVLPREFRLYLPAEAFLMRDAEVWKPLRINYVTPRARDDAPYTAVARLKRGVSLAHAQAQMDLVAARLRSEHAVHRDNELRLRVVPLHHDVVKGIQPVLVLLMFATGLFLVVACVNVASLQVARAAAREREVATRVALGASRWQLSRQLLVEGGLLALVGGVLGIILGWAAVRAIVRLAPAQLPRISELGIDWTVLTFVVATCTVSAVVFGIAPALQRAGVRLDALRGTGYSSDTRGRARLRRGLITAQIALSLVLLMGAGLLVRSVMALQRIEPGYVASGVLTFRLALPMSKYATPGARLVAAADLERRFREIPGVTALGAVSQLPLTGAGHFGTITVPGVTTAPGEGVTADLRAVTADYFTTLGTKLLAGRFFTPADDSTQTPTAIIDATLAARLWPGERAIGKQLTYSVGYTVPNVTVVGVVEHMRITGLTTNGWPQVFVSYYRNPWPFRTFVVRSTADPDQLAAAVRRAAAAAGPYVMVDAFRPMSALVDDAISDVRFSLLLLETLGMLAILLAAVGLYGLVSYVVSRRTREFGLRLALGESPGGLGRLVLRHGLALVAMGIAFGVPLAVVGGYLVQRLLYGVSPADPLTLAIVVLALVGVTGAACYWPARRASRVDPLVSLRAD